MHRTNACLALSVCFSSVFVSLALAQDQDDRTQAVNQQMDAVESQFNNPQPYPTESPNIHPDRVPLSTTANEFFSPELIPTNKSQPVLARVVPRKNTWDMGSQIFYYKYGEPDVGVKLHGPMYGYFLNYAYRPADPNFFNNFLTNVYMLQARYATSHDLEYGGSGIVKGKYDDDVELRGLVAKDYYMGNSSRFTPYAGFGFRYLVDRGNGEISSTGNYGYDRKSHYLYLPIGGDFVRELPRNWEVDFNLEYDIFLQGWQKSYLSDGNQFTGDTDPDVTNLQNQGFGLRTSVKLLKRGQKVDFYVEPYLLFWDIEESDAKTTIVEGAPEEVVEPHNNTLEVGSKFGIQF